MLNELYQVVVNLELSGIPLRIRHKALDPMGKNEPTLLIRVNAEGSAQRVEVIEGKHAGKLLRVSHGFKGAAFPGFNLPTPLHTLSERQDEERLDVLLKHQKRRAVRIEDVTRAVSELFGRSKPLAPGKRQLNLFRLSVQELVAWLSDDLANAGDELANLRRLLQVVEQAKLKLGVFTQQLAAILADPDGDHSAHDRLLFAEWLFKKRKLPIFLDLAEDNHSALPVSDPRMGELLNQHLLRIDPLPYTAEARREGRGTSQAVDAFTGRPCDLPSTFEAPKLAVLGNVIIFSNDADAANCRFRYGQGNSATFKVSRGTVQKMAGALLALASEDREGLTCRSIPGNRAKRDERTGKMVVVRELLIAFPEDEPATTDPYADLFGGQQGTFSEPDFAARAKPVLKALDGKLAANVNQPIRLLTISPVDKANKQIGLNRAYTVREVAEGARDWQAGAYNCPEVSLPFYDKESKKRVWKDRTVPSPLEVAVVINRVWSADPTTGLRDSYERAVTTSDAYEMFLGSGILREQKTRRAFQILLARMTPVFIRTATFKVTRNYRELDWLQKRKPLSEDARWQVLKAVALLGVFLRQLNQDHEDFMKDTIYQIGRLLALADSLHFQYCKWVRTSTEKRNQGKVDAPRELIGNAVFNFALDQPVSALARLADRIRPYRGWADTYSGEDSGLVHWFLRQMADCERQIDIVQLPPRMQDIHKAQLLLGYLADNPKSKSEGE